MLPAFGGTAGSHPCLGTAVFMLVCGSLGLTSGCCLPGSVPPLASLHPPGWLPDPSPGSLPWRLDRPQRALPPGSSPCVPALVLRTLGSLCPPAPCPQISCPPLSRAPLSTDPPEKTHLETACCPAPSSGHITPRLPNHPWLPSAPKAEFPVSARHPRPAPPVTFPLHPDPTPQASPLPLLWFAALLEPLGTA